MQEHAWIFDLDDSQHTVEYIRGGGLRELVVLVDGTQLVEMDIRRLINRTKVRFNIGKHKCLLYCSTLEGVWMWDLYVDGRLIY